MSDYDPPKSAAWTGKTDNALIASERKKLAELRKSMREMLDCYWGQGDGDTPPEFVVKAARLSGWKSPDPLMVDALKAFNRKKGK